MSMLMFTVIGFVAIILIAWLFSAMSDPARVDEEEALRAGNIKKPGTHAGRA